MLQVGTLPGANCMLEYKLDEAIELLQTNESNARTTLKSLEEDTGGTGSLLFCFGIADIPCNQYNRINKYVPFSLQNICKLHVHGTLNKF